MKLKRIGIIDSGVGGLTILKQLMDNCYQAQYFYISDEENVPYGGKLQSFMLERMKSMTEKLILQKVDGILIACNTATSETIDQLRLDYKIPFIGIEPYINYINKNSVDSNQKVALILTEATFNSKRFNKLLQSKDPHNIIDVYPLKNLALIIESLKHTPINQIKNKICDELSVIQKNKYSRIILGCTHYPLVKDLIEKYLNTKTVDPSIHVIDQLAHVLNIIQTDIKTYTFFYNSNNSTAWQKIDLNLLKIFTHSHQE